MRTEHVYLGTWFQRTNLHLEEVYHFLKYGRGIEGLSQAKVEELRAALGAKDAEFHEALINWVAVSCGPFDVTITEDGVMLASTEAKDIKGAHDALEAFRSGALEPALRHLASRGAPIPKEHMDIDPHGFLLAVVRGASDDDIKATFTAFGDVAHSHASSEGIRVMTGRRIELVDLGETMVSDHEAEAFVRDLVFFREFERQLHAYLRAHRKIWDQISAIREARSLKYSDFPSVRTEIMRFEMTLGIVRARLAQMDDILGARRAGEEKTVSRLLAGLGMFDFNSLHASRRYVSHLWDMTDDYADGTLGLLETLYQENTQRELNALKFITLTTAVTSFFGMNIAFPWEERWALNRVSSLEVVVLITIVSFAIYFLLRVAIQNRNFVIKEEKAKE